MGIVNFGVPKELVLFLKEKFKVNTFIETGTFKGKSALWASKHFERIVTIEFSQEIYQETANKLGHVSNIEFRYGDSRQELRKVLSELSEPSIFWLDAHWCASGSYGEDDQCPLLEEISIINDSQLNHLVLIDDARLFLSPPPRPNDYRQYPNLTESIEKLNELKNRYVVVFEDVIVSVPQVFSEVLANYLQERNTEAWENRTKAMNVSKFGQSVEKIKSLVRIWV